MKARTMDWITPINRNITIITLLIVSSFIACNDSSIGFNNQLISTDLRVQETIIDTLIIFSSGHNDELMAFDETLIDIDNHKREIISLIYSKRYIELESDDNLYNYIDSTFEAKYYFEVLEFYKAII